VLLQIPPAEWKIREQTLLQIADAFPTMTAFEFRLSLRRLVDQAKSGKQAIHNPNAWLKASFERNNGPLVTEREIEIRVRQQEANIPAQLPTRRPEFETQDLEIMRRYMTASPEDRAEIDQQAEGRVGRLLMTVSLQKHVGLREQARIDCAREFFAARDKAAEERGTPENP